MGDRRNNESLSPTKTRSILNLTSSTLAGIYSGTTGSGGVEALTPWGTGAQTPNRKSMDGYMPEEPQIAWSERTNKPQSLAKLRSRRRGFKGYYLPLALQTTMLFASGAGFGSIVTHLHKTQDFQPLPVPSGRASGYFHIAWGLFGILVGNGLPLVDEWLGDEIPARPRSPVHRRSNSFHESKEDDSLGPDWYSVVRSVGAFVGIAFALVSTFSHSSTIVLTIFVAKAALAINVASVVDPRPGQPTAVVSPGQIIRRVPLLDAGQLGVHVRPFTVQPSLCAGACDSPSCGIGAGGSIHVASEHRILRVVVLRRHRSEAPAIINQ
jgi:hypothetical protein